MNAYNLLGYPLLILGLFQIALMVICLTKGINNRAALICAFPLFFSAVYSLSAGATYILAGEKLDYDWTYRNCWIGWLAIPGVMHMVLHIGAMDKLIKYAVYPSYAFWIFVWLLTITTNYVDVAPVSLIPYQEIEAPWETTLRTMALLQLLAVIILIFKLYRNITGVRRAKVQYLLFGFLANGIAAILTSSIMQLSGSMGFDPALTSYFGILLSGPLFYSMTRQRLFDIRFLLSRLLFTGIITIGAGIIHYLIIRYLMQVLPLGFAATIAALLIGMVLFLSPIFEYVRVWSFKVLNRGRSSSDILKELSVAITSTNNPDDLFRRFGEILRNTLGLQSICFYAAEDDDFKMKHCSGVEPTYFDEELRFLTGGVLSKILVDNREVFIKDEHVSEDLSLSREDSAGVEAELDSFAMDEALVPLAARGSVIGIMALGPKLNSSGFSREEIALLGAAGNQMGLALENARLFEQAVGDGLTGLFHQRYFKARVETELVRARRHGGRFALLLMDVDYFKSINDRFGHVVGDGVLQSVAAIMKSSFRAEDVLARYGGEEFAVLLIETQPERAFSVAERFRAAVEAFNFHDNLKVTISVGLFIFDGKKDGSAVSVLDIINRADQALYQAKNNGRNQVVVFEEKLQRADIPES